MLDYKLERASGILIIEPKAPLTVDDFKALTADVGRYLASHDTLTGILLGVAHVPGSGEFRCTHSAHAVCARSPEAHCSCRRSHR